MSLRALVVLALLCALAVALLFRVREPEETPEAAAAPLVEIDATKVSGVELEHAGVTVRLERIGTDRWRMRSPQEAEADPRTVETLFRAIADARRVRVVETDPGDGSAFGLDRPVSVLRLFVRGAAAPTSVRLGRRSPVGSERYAAVGDAPVVLADASLGTALEREVEDFVERRLLPVDAERIRRIEIDRSGGRLVLAREGTDWALVEPYADRADATQADGLARALGTLEVARGSARRVERASRLPIRVRVVDDVGNAYEAAIGPPPGDGQGVGARLPGGDGGDVPARSAVELERGASEFRERRLATFSNPDVREIALEHGGKRLIVRREKEGSDWASDDGTGTASAADARRVEDLLDRLRWLRGTAKDDGRFAAAETVVTLRGEGGDLVRLEMGAKGSAAPGVTSPSQRLVRSTWRPGLLFGVEDEALGELPSTPKDLLPAQSPSPAGGNR